MDEWKDDYTFPSINKWCLHKVCEDGTLKFSLLQHIVIIYLVCVELGWLEITSKYFLKTHHLSVFSFREFILLHISSPASTRLQWTVKYPSLETDNVHINHKIVFLKLFLNLRMFYHSPAQNNLRRRSHTEVFGVLNEVMQMGHLA